MTKLLVVSNLFLPDTCGGAPIFTDLVHGLAERGLDVTVRCAYPYYPEWKDKSGQNGIHVQKTVDNGVTIERYGLFIPSNPKSLIQRLLYESSYLMSLSRSLFKPQAFDAMIVFCPLMGSVAYGAMCRSLFGCPALLCVQDLPADAAVSSGITKSGTLRTIFKKIQSVLFNRYDVWRTINPVMRDQLEGMRTNGRGFDEVLLIPDWLHPTLAAAISSLPSKIDRAPSNPIKLLYSGNIGAKQGLLEYCQILQRSFTPFDFVINGEGNGAAQIADWVQSVGDTRFRVGPLLSEEGFAQAMHTADYFVITEKPGLVASFFPSKSIPAMASGTPILAVSSPHSPLGVEMSEFKVGYWSTWDDTVSMQAALNPGTEQFAVWQRNAVRRFTSHYARERCIDAFYATVMSMVRNP